MSPPPRTWWMPAAHAIAIGLIGVGALGQEPLLEGGLAVLAATWLFATFFGIALARAEWLAGERPVPERDLLLFVTVLSAGALAGALPMGWSLGAWAAGALLSRFGRVVPWVGPLAVLTLLGIGGSTAVAHGMPWEALTPNASTWRDWLGTAFGAGALLGWAPAAWSRSGAPHPGRSGLPMAAVGATLLGLGGWTLAQAASWLGQADPVVLAVLPLFAAGSWLSVGATRHLGLVLALGLASTLFFAVPAQRALWWSVSLPLLLGVGAGMVAIRSRSLLAGASAVTLLVAAGLCYPGLPSGLGTAAAAALPWVGAVWFVGVRQQGAS